MNTSARTPRPFRAITLKALAFTLAFSFAAPLSGAARAAQAEAPRKAAEKPRFVKAAKAVPGRYVVLLEGQPEEAKAQGVSAADVSFELALAYGGSVHHVYEHGIKGFSIEASEEEAKALSGDPRVAVVQEDAIFSIDASQADAPWGLDRIDQSNLPLDEAYCFNGNGAGTNVYVLDSGVRSTHDEFEDGVTLVDFVDDDNNFFTNAADDSIGAPDGEDLNGHGTHVAATIAGQQFGVAKEAKVFGLRVMGRNANGAPDRDGGFGSTSEILAGLMWLVLNHQKPAVANMSIGGGGDIVLDTAVAAAVLAGVTMVVSAGNNNVNASTQSPARVVEAITVGATDATDTRATFCCGGRSNFGSLVDLFAPGASILSAGVQSDSDTATLSGTSMAAPHVAGAAALLLAGSPNLSPASVQTQIKNAATTGVVQDRGAGSPDRLLSTLFNLSVPAAPSDLAIPSFSRTSAFLTWRDNATNESGYTIEVELIGPHIGDGTRVITVGPDTSELKVTGLARGRRHRFTVRAFNGAGQSASVQRSVQLRLF
jgi:subtilisin family serine protease